MGFSAVDGEYTKCQVESTRRQQKKGGMPYFAFLFFRFLLQSLTIPTPTQKTQAPINSIVRLTMIFQAMNPLLSRFIFAKKNPYCWQPGARSSIPVHQNHIWKPRSRAKTRNVEASNIGLIDTRGHLPGFSWGLQQVTSRHRYRGTEK